MEAERRNMMSGSSENRTVEREMSDIISNLHPHPLIFYREGKPDGCVQEICCSICRQLFRPPAFGCSNCKFYVHQSCIKLPTEIPNPFHTIPDSQIQTHLLHLTTDSSLPCNRCGQNPYDATYIYWPVGKNRFAIDIPCAITDPKASSLLKITAGGGGGGGGGEFQHFSHPHPLTLHLKEDPERGNIIHVCLVCQSPIIPPSTYYFCPQSNCHSYNFHQKCAELSRQISNSNLHHHPLSLFALPWEDNTLCLCCKSKCTNFFYCCSPCGFNLHVECVSSFNHKHDFRILRKELPYECQLCHMSDKGFPWLCTVCLIFAHKKCAILEMSEHHLAIATITQTSNNDGVLEFEIPHFSHKQHKLTLGRHSEDRHCDGCMRQISALSQSYACQLCGFYLHQECATLPTRQSNYLLHSHELSLVYIKDFVFSCVVCLQYCHGFAYCCKECHYAIDIRCATITFPFTHLSHDHPLTNYNGEEKHKCKACGEDLKDMKVVGCERCNFYLDVSCAHLPLAVRNRFDEHPLILTFVNFPLPLRKKLHEELFNTEDEESIANKNWIKECDLFYTNIFYREDKINKECQEYYCDICEEERKEDEWFYNCWLCCFSAHPWCVLNGVPFLKSAQFEGHCHPLNWVEASKYSACSACGQFCGGNLAFACGLCKFNVHAIGQCYHEQLTQGRITFIMPSLRYRSIPLYQDLNEIMWTKLTSLDNFNKNMESYSYTTKMKISYLCSQFETFYIRYKQRKENHLPYMHRVIREIYDLRRSP